MWIHRVARTYGSDPYTVAGWAPGRLALAIATMRLAIERRNEQAHAAKAMGVVVVGDL